MADKHIDQPTGTETVGHEWDGIEELNTPMPRWWVWTYIACIVFSIGYVVVYPAFPLLEKGTEGLFGWTSRGQLADEMKAEEVRQAPLLAALAETPIEQLPLDSALMQQAVSGGRAAFRVNCVQCHGAGAAGSSSYPNLNDDDWLWGGDLKAIEYTLLHGIRHPGDDASRTSMMPAFDGIFSPEELAQTTDHVLALTGKAGPNAAGAQLYDTNCASCHGAQGQGDPAFGAPDLADAIWLYGSSREEIARQIMVPRHGVMPGWQNRLDPATIKMLAAYVHSLGGGEDFVEAAENPAVEADGQP